MATETLQKLQQDEATRSAAERQRQSEAIAEYRELVTTLATDSEVSQSKIEKILGAVSRTASQLVGDVEAFRKRKSLYDHMSELEELMERQRAAQQAVTRFRAEERPRLEREIDEKERELYRKSVEFNLSIKAAEGARDQLMGMAPRESLRRIEELKVEQKRVAVQAVAIEKEAERKRRRATSLAHGTHDHTNPNTVEERRNQSEAARATADHLSEKSDAIKLQVHEIREQIDQIATEMLLPEAVFETD